MENANQNYNLKTKDETGYWRTNNEVFFVDTKIKNADPKTFYFFNNTVFAVDKNRAYARDMNLHGVDLSTFTPIAGSFAKDKSHVYYWHNTINGADVKSFKVIDAENAYSRDQSYLYSGHLKVDQVDPDTFQYLDSGIIKDNKAVYSLSKSQDAIKITTLHTADPKTLVALGWRYFKDINTVFVVTFEVRCALYLERMRIVFKF